MEVKLGNYSFDMKEEFLQPSEIRIAKDLCCCSNNTKLDSYEGYTSTSSGYMIVMKCRRCGKI